MPPKDRAQLRRAAADQLESLQLAGVLQIPKRKATKSTTERPAATERPAGEPQQAAGVIKRKSQEKPPQKPVAAASQDVPPVKTTTAGWQQAATTSLFEAGDTTVKPAAPASLEIIQQEVAACTRCNELATTRTQTVFGVGNPKARLCFLGEAPGADEDRTGIPFVGRGGQLLTKIIEACRLKREDVYILNMIKCRPPNNRNPLPHELANCRGYLEQQLALIQPEFICCLGAVPSQNLLGSTVPIGKLRGKFHTFRGAKVVCTYHPAFLLRSPSFKKETWEDMKMLMREMGMEL